MDSIASMQIKEKHEINASDKWQTYEIFGKIKMSLRAAMQHTNRANKNLASMRVAKH